MLSHQWVQYCFASLLDTRSLLFSQGLPTESLISFNVSPLRQSALIGRSVHRHFAKLSKSAKASSPCLANPRNQHPVIAQDLALLG